MGFCEGENGQKLETDPRFPSGEWEGFYIYGFGPNARHFISCYMTFQEGKVSGAGVDDIDRFIWKGSYDIERGRCALHKYYPTHDVFYDGYAEKNGIWGSWEITGPIPSRGGFHLWPKGLYESIAKGEEEEVPDYVENEFRVLEVTLGRGRKTL